MPQLKLRHAVFAGLLAAVALATGQAAASSVAQVQGTVRDRASGAPLAGATITLAELGFQTVSAADGSFSFPGISIEGDSALATVTTTASGYGVWTLQDVRLLAADTLILDVALGSEPVLIVVPPPRAEVPSWPTEPALESLQALGGAAEPLDADQPLPTSIRVRVTGYPYCDTSRPYTVETIDFKEYAKHVLPNEWVANWPYESLRAGAMAVKMYAWSYVAVGGKYADADVYDSTCDQVYNPAVSYNSTNKAVDFTWNWRLTRNEQLLRTFYRAYLSQCEDVGLEGNCMGQIESAEMAYDLYTWDEILAAFYDDSALSPVWNPPGGFSLRFYGNGYGDIDRVKIAIDPQVPADIGSGDFTVEWWMKALAAENTAGACTPGGDNWIFGNIVFDRDVFGDGDYGDYGISLADGRLAFGVAQGSSGETICGTTEVADGAWHHLAVTRSLTGELAIYVDGELDGSGTGPAGDLSYRDGRSTSYSNDPYLVLGAEKHDADSGTYPSFSGWLDEIRISDSVRYSDDFSPPSDRFSADANTAALWHLNEGFGNLIGDSSGAAGGPSDGVRNYGGVSNGPEWTDDTNWYVSPPTPTPTSTPTASATPTASQTSTASITPTASETPTPTEGPSPTPSSTASATPTPSSTPLPTATSTPSPTATDTPLPTATATPSPTPSSTPLPTATDTPLPTATDTPLPTATATPSPTPTHTPTPSPTPSSTPLPTATASPTPTPSDEADLNGDGSVNVLDVQLCVNVFLGMNTDPDVVSAADVNGDGSVNVLDVQAIANIVLSG